MAEEEQEAPVLLVTHMNNILHSVFSDVEVYINNEQIYNSNVCTQTLRFQQLRGAILEYKGVLHCQGYVYEEFPHETLGARLFERFFTRRLKYLAEPVASCCMVNWGLTFSVFLNWYIQRWNLDCD